MPISIAAALAEVTAALRAHDIDSPRLDAEVLLAHALGTDRASLLAHHDDTVAAEVAAVYRALVARRARGEPVAYLTGHRAWYDLDLRVTPDVLTPRPETEGVLERALAWARTREAPAVADIGTGSGALAIALARALPASTVYATDVSGAALAVARANAVRYGASRIIFLEGDLLAPLPQPVHLIVANLPYIGDEEYAGLMPDVRLYEPRLALVGGRVGHELTARLLAQSGAASPASLHPGGAIMLELGPPQAQPLLDAARAAFPRAAIRLDVDYAGLARYLIIET